MNSRTLSRLHLFFPAKPHSFSPSPPSFSALPAAPAPPAVPCPDCIFSPPARYPRYSGTSGSTQGEKKLRSPCTNTVNADIPVSIVNPITMFSFFYPAAPSAACFLFSVLFGFPFYSPFPDFSFSFFCPFCLMQPAYPVFRLSIAYPPPEPPPEMCARFQNT